MRHPALPLRHRHGYAVDLHRDLPGQTCGILPGVLRSPPRARTSAERSGTHRTPARIHRIRAGHNLKRPQHRFLAYAFSSRSPGPTHPAVLGRPDFVAAAPTLTDVLRLRLPPASPHRYDGEATKVSHLHSNNQRLAAHHRISDSPAATTTSPSEVDGEHQIDRPPVTGGEVRDVMVR